MAERIAISRRRVVDRASCRLATFAVAVIRSNPTAARKTRRAGRISAVIASRAREAETSGGVFVPNTAIAVIPRSGPLLPRDVASAAACVGLTPARNRGNHIDHGNPTPLAIGCNGRWDIKRNPGASLVVGKSQTAIHHTDNCERLSIGAEFCGQPHLESHQTAVATIRRTER